MKQWWVFLIITSLYLLTCANNRSKLIPETDQPVQNEASPEITAPEIETPSPPAEPTLILVEAVPPVEPVLLLDIPVLILIEPVPLPVEPDPLPVEPDPLPVEPSPPPVEPEPLLVEPSSPPFEPTFPPAELDPIPVEPPPAEPVLALVEPVRPQTEPAPAPVEPLFDLQNIPIEVYEETKSEIQELVEHLNRIIRARNFNSWISYLTEDYYQKINSREFINNLVIRFPIYRGRINNARDYFSLVVVPSRANDRVDEIEFITENEVRAYTVDARGRAVVLYHLEKLDGQWKIAD